MILVDTSVWIEFFKNKEPYFTELRELTESYKVVTHQVIFGELLQGSKNEREANLISDYWINLEKIGNDDSFILAGHLSSSLRLYDKGIGLIDSFLFIIVEKIS